MSNTTRIQVNLSNELTAKADEYSAKMGVSRSAFCAMLIGQGLMSYDKAFDAMEK